MTDQTTQEIPEPDMPSQHTQRWYPPPVLRLDHEHGSRNHETDASDDLRRPVRSDELVRCVQSFVDRRYRNNAGDSEDDDADQQEGASEESQATEVVGT